MSIPVELEQLAATMEGYGFAYLLTVSDDLRAHAVAATPEWDGDELVMSAGRRTVANAAVRSSISLVWPPTEPGGYSLICDGDCSAADGVVRFRPAKAVLHRPADHAGAASAAGADVAGSCGNDCVPVLSPTS